MKKILIVAVIGLVFIGVLFHYLITTNRQTESPAVSPAADTTEAFVIEELTAPTTSPSSEAVSAPSAEVDSAPVEQSVSNPVKQPETSVVSEPTISTATPTTLEAKEQARRRIEFKNSTIKLSINNIRPRAEISYSNNDFTYAGVCNDAWVRSLLETTQRNITGSTEGVVVNAIPNSDSVACLDGTEWYVVQSPLLPTLDGESSFWCVDSTGFADTVSKPLPAGSQQCVAS